MRENYKTKYKEYSRYREEELSLLDQLVGKLTSLLKLMKIHFSIIGSVAGTQYGLTRPTDDIDILINKSDRKKVNQAVSKIEFEDRMPVDLFYVGEISGDGIGSHVKTNPKGLPFVDPSLISKEIEGIPYMTLPALVEYKISSGLYGDEREKDFLDVRTLIRKNNLPENFGDKFRADLKRKYKSIWIKAQKKPSENSNRIWYKQ